MKQIIAIIVTWCAALSLQAQSIETQCSQKGGVVINGVCWATRNVDAPGTFAAAPEEYGMFYQWNRMVGWNVSEPLTSSPNGTTWNSSTPAGTEWAKENDPSPAGYRLPSLNEIKTLLDANHVTNVWVTQNGVLGRKFTDKASGASIFLPAASFRNGDASLSAGDEGGYYWTNTQYGNDFAFGLDFNSTGPYWYGYARNNGQFVRSVAE